MVNIIKDIVDKLDGFSSDTHGFAVIAFTMTEKNEVTVNVRPYIKKEEDEDEDEDEEEEEGMENWRQLPEMESWRQLPEMCERLYAKYSSEGFHYEVIEAVNKGSYWTLAIKAIEVK